MGLGLLAATGLVVSMSGCNLRDEPGYNRYAPTNGEPTPVKRAEGLMNLAGRALDSLDEVIDNTID